MDSSPFIFRFLSDHRRGVVREQGKEATAWSVNMIDELSNLQMAKLQLRHALKWNSTLRKFDNSSILFLSSEFPRLGIFPRDVNRMIKMQQEAFAAIQKSQTKEIFVNEVENWRAGKSE